MPAEIYWTAHDGDDSDLIPGQITRIVRSGGELRIPFAGRESQYGDQYEGLLRIQLIAGAQTLEGTQRYRAVDGEWEPVPFSVVGNFEDARLTEFSGVWTEGGKSFQVEIVGLPGLPKGTAARRRK